MERTIEASTTVRASIHDVQAMLLFDPGRLVGVVDGSSDAPPRRTPPRLAAPPTSCVRH